MYSVFFHSIARCLGYPILEQVLVRSAPGSFHADVAEPLCEAIRGVLTLSIPSLNGRV